MTENAVQIIADLQEQHDKWRAKALCYKIALEKIRDLPRRQRSDEMNVWLADALEVVDGMGVTDRLAKADEIIGAAERTIQKCKDIIDCKDILDSWTECPMCGGKVESGREGRGSVRVTHMEGCQKIMQRQIECLKEAIRKPTRWPCPECGSHIFLREPGMYGVICCSCETTVAWDTVYNLDALARASAQL